MEVIGFKTEEVMMTFQLVASILKLGNVEFSPKSNKDGTDGCDLSDMSGMIDWLVFNVNFCSISATSLREQLLY